MTTEETRLVLRNMSKSDVEIEKFVLEFDEHHPISIEWKGRRYRIEEIFENVTDTNSMTTEAEKAAEEHARTIQIPWPLVNNKVISAVVLQHRRGVGYEST